MDKDVVYIHGGTLLRHIKLNPFKRVTVSSRHPQWLANLTSIHKEAGLIPGWNFKFGGHDQEKQTNKQTDT